MENDDLRNQLGLGSNNGVGLYGSKGLRSTNYTNQNFVDFNNNFTGLGHPQDMNNNFTGLGRAEYPSSATAQFYGLPAHNNDYADYNQGSGLNYNANNNYSSDYGNAGNTNVGSR